MKGKLITYAESTSRKTQHKAPCSDCPFARAALEGWLGGFSVEEWLEAVHGEERIDCHVYRGPQCAGAAIYRANVAKSPRDSALLRLPAGRELVFATPTEFCQHHREQPKG